MTTRALLTGLGVVATGLGALGMVLPLMPATPFLLIAAWAFARSSPQFSAWLHNHRAFGQVIQAYRERRGLSPIHKLSTLALLWISLSVSAIVAPHTAIRLLLAAVGVGVTLHLVRMPAAKRESCPVRGAAATGTTDVEPN